MARAPAPDRSDESHALAVIAVLEAAIFTPRLVEHDASSFAALDSVLDTELTTEARLILECYLTPTRTPVQKS